ncbi:MAG: L,D-transpeptidase family protein [Verrucomicrobiales bacterium]
MRYLKKVKMAGCVTVAAGCGLLAPVLPAQDIDSLRPKTQESPPPLDARLATLLKSLHPPLEPQIHAVVDRLEAGSTTIKISLSERRLRVFAGEELALDCPVSTGRPSSATPEGVFTLAAKITAPKGLDYGNIIAPDGTILMRGVFAKYDALPAGASFNSIVPKCAFQLSEGGPLLFAGEATGAATTNGAVIVPEKIALLLSDRLALGVKVEISS